MLALQLLDLPPDTPKQRLGEESVHQDAEHDQVELGLDEQLRIGGVEIFYHQAVTS